MHIIKEVLRLKYDAALSHRQIAAACGISKGVVAKFLALAEANGLKWSNLPNLTRSYMRLE